MKNAVATLRFLLDVGDRGEQTALLTIADVIGSAARARGTHMAVSETGAFHGSFSGGCVEAAVVGEARRVITTGRTELIRFGAGSRFIDIRLPCGGGLDVLITPDPSRPVLTAALARLQARQTVMLRLGRNGHLGLVPSESADECREDELLVCQRPDLRMVTAGYGAETTALTRLSLAYGAQVLVLSPDPATVEAATAMGADAWRLTPNGPSPHLVTDRHAAVVLLFHD